MLRKATGGKTLQDSIHSWGWWKIKIKCRSSADCRQHWPLPLKAVPAGLF